MTKGAEKVRIDVRLLSDGRLLPEDACIERLQALVGSRWGVNAAHLSEGGPDGGLCVHYDPAVLSLGDVRALVTRSCATISDRYGHLLETSRSMHVRRARKLSASLLRAPGILDARVTPDGAVRVEFDRTITSEEHVRVAIAHAGIPLRGRGAAADGPDHDDHGLFSPRIELGLSLACGAAVGGSWMIGAVAGIESVAGALSIAGFVLGFVPTARDALASIRERRFEIDFLMLVAAIGAATLGKWWEGALLLFLFGIGHALEGYAMGRARRAIEALSELAPDTALLLRDGREVEVAANDVEVGDILRIKPDSRIPCDGVVVRGTSSVDQSSVTGESVPVDKSPAGDLEKFRERGARADASSGVFSGTLNGSGTLEIQVTKNTAESTLSRVVKLVTEAETLQSPTQRITERFERVFVPAVMVLVVVLLVGALAIGESFAEAFYRAMAVLVAASPCALAIATPSAVLSAVATAGRAGVLVKGGGPLETLGKVTAIAFDKTGTLTKGKPQVTDMVAAAGVSDVELAATVVAVEQQSDHPLAVALVRDLGARLVGQGLPIVSELQSLTGRGLNALIEGESVFIGKPVLFSEIDGPGIPVDLASRVSQLEIQGRTTMVVRRGGRYLGAIGLMDSPRDMAKRTLEELRRLGIKRMLMISGDNQRVASAVAEDVGLDEAFGDLMPEDKVEVIGRLRNEEGEVAMVGDGVNDAPAMASASVGIAMGAAGSDVALETADIALLADDLSLLPFAVGLSRRATRVIRQNLWFSLGMVAFLIPATILGLNMGAAVALHEGSTLVVVANALRLLGYRTSLSRPPSAL